MRSALAPVLLLSLSIACGVEEGGAGSSAARPRAPARDTPSGGSSEETREEPAADPTAGRWRVERLAPTDDTFSSPTLAVRGRVAAVGLSALSGPRTYLGWPDEDGVRFEVLANDVSMTQLAFDGRGRLHAGAWRPRDMARVREVLYGAPTGDGSMRFESLARCPRQRFGSVGVAVDDAGAPTVVYACEGRTRIVRRAEGEWVTLHELDGFVVLDTVEGSGGTLHLVGLAPGQRAPRYVEVRDSAVRRVALPQDATRPRLAVRRDGTALLAFYRLITEPGSSHDRIIVLATVEDGGGLTEEVVGPGTADWLGLDAQQRPVIVSLNPDEARARVRDGDRWRVVEVPDAREPVLRDAAVDADGRLHLVHTCADERGGNEVRYAVGSLAR